MNYEEMASLLLRINTRGLPGIRVGGEKIKWLEDMGFIEVSETIKREEWSMTVTDAGFAFLEKHKEMPLCQEK